MLSLLGLAAAPSSGSAADVSSGRLEQLARDAGRGDGSALATLNGVTSVDGRPADPGAALAAAAPGGDLDGRLREMERAVRESRGASPGDADDVAQAKTDARETDHSGGSGWGGISLGLPPPVALLILGGVLVGALIVARAIGRRRVLEVAAASAAGSRGDEGSAGALERRAKAAEKAGDFATAIGLRFAAGLLRLDRAGAVELRPSLTPAGAARESGSSTLARLAASYSAVLYGGRAAGEGEARAARDGWPDVLREAKEGR